LRVQTAQRPTEEGAEEGQSAVKHKYETALQQQRFFIVFFASTSTRPTASSSKIEMSKAYPLIDPYSTGHLKVSDVHTL
jgi:hypothetical protein